MWLPRHPRLMDVIQRGVFVVARMEDDPIAEANRLAGRELPRLVDKVERRRRDEAVVASEPGARVPGVFGMIEDGDALDDIPLNHIGRLAFAMVSAPGRRLAEGGLFAQLAFRVDQRSAAPDRDVACRTDREERVVGARNDHVLDGDPADVEIEEAGSLIDNANRYSPREQFRGHHT